MFHLWDAEFLSRAVPCTPERCNGASSAYRRAGCCGRLSRLVAGGKQRMTAKRSPKPMRESRMRQNIAALCFLLGLLLAGLWLFSALRTYLRIEACVEAGYRNCDTDARP